MAVTFDHIKKPSRRAEAEALDQIFREVSGWSPQPWGKMVGYGAYRYTYASGREGVWLATGFAVRERDIALYILPGYTAFDEIAARLGPHKRGKSCWYVKRLSDVDAAALRDLIRAGLDDLSTQYPIEPS